MIEISDSEDEKENKGSSNLSRVKWQGSSLPYSGSIQHNVNNFSKVGGDHSKHKQLTKVAEDVFKKSKSKMTIDEKIGAGGDNHGHAKNKKLVTKVLESSGESDDNLDDFLAKFTSKKKSPERQEDEMSNFIVSSEDSDEFSTPKLSLRDRIFKGKTSREVSTSSYRTKTQIPETDSDDELPEIPPILKKNPKPRGKKDKPRLPSSKETSEDEDSPISPKPDDEDSPLPPKSVRKTSTAKKTYVLDSDSESSDVQSSDSPSSSDDPDISPHNTKTTRPLPKTGKTAPIAPKPVRKTSTAKKTYVIDSDSDGESSDSPCYSDDPVISPPKTKSARPPPKTGVKPSKAAPSGKAAPSSTHTSTLTFLSSLTADVPIHKCHPEAKKYLTKFNNSKVELSQRLYQLFNTECFDSCLPQDFDISWNVRLTKTAGLCHSRRYKDRHGIEVRSSRIELSTKVVDSCDRLRDTLIHEMCHAASWIISGYRDGHGPLWKTWANKAMVRFPELPVIGRCHSYAIRTKYTYKCEKCGQCIGRHSKSLDTDRKVCGKCHGRFQLVVNYKGNKVNEAGDSAAKPPKTPNPFALFVKENYKVYKKPGVSHGDVMKVLGDKFKEVKISKN